ncbi:HAD-IB family hydrolase [Sphingomonas gilva]|uniref:HAD-IB family hydrolase n=2 Tax=Sphingomonas gilva TaxID=2305907 RepID=A0A396S330_9SPHN|nr:HAD-IB family hydrolase [Sphingomonas gilva]
MDKTITRVPTWVPFLAYCMKRRARWRIVFIPVAIAASIAFWLKLIDRARLKEISHHWLLGKHLKPSSLSPLVEGFARHTMETNVLAAACDRIAADKAEGYRLVLATASNRMYAAAIAEQLGFDDCVATNSIIGLDDRVHATIDGSNCYGPAKLDMVKAWMAAAGLDRAEAHIRFYSDHPSDRPAFEWADEAYPANPSLKLRALAAEKGWPLLDWR